MWASKSRNHHHHYDTITTKQIVRLHIAYECIKRRAVIMNLLMLTGTIFLEPNPFKWMMEFGFISRSFHFAQMKKKEHKVSLNIWSLVFLIKILLYRSILHACEWSCRTKKFFHKKGEEASNLAWNYSTILSIKMRVCEFDCYGVSSSISSIN